MTLNLTTKEILSDIESFQDRIQLAKQKLSKLPLGPLPYLQHKDREKQQRDLVSDIRHYKQIIVYAKDALNGTS